MRYPLIMDHYGGKVYMVFQGILCLLFLIAHPVSAAALTCTGNSSIGGSFAVASGSLKITTPRSATADFYSIGRTRMGAGNISISCDGAYKINSTLVNAPTNILYGENISENAVPTTNPDIATIMQASDDEDFTGNVVKTWPDYSTVTSNFAAGSVKNIPFYMTVRLRLNFPDTNPKIAPGPFGSFTGATLVIYVTPVNTGDTIGTCPTGSTSLNGDNRTCILFSRLITSPGTNIYSGTCEMLIPNKVVNLGQHPGASGENSPWKDASFDIKCPTAWGYLAKMMGGTNAVDDSDAKGKVNPNKALTITVAPYTPIISALSGTFELNGAGAPGYASGYGIQLAWGPPSAQIPGNSIPTKPVSFSGPSLLNLSNSNYTTGNYTPGSAAVPAGVDGRVYMSARYVRTTAPFQPGVADGKVEVIVSYN